MKRLVLETKQLSKEIKQKQILSNISLQMFEGEVIGLIGPNGAGKTSLMRVLIGLTKKYSGEVTIHNYDSKITRLIGSMIETPNFYNDMTGQKNLEYFAAISGGINQSEIKSIVKRLKMEGYIHQKVKSYSLGMRQRLGIGQALLNHPSILILDEPMNGLDPHGVMEMRELLKEISEDFNMSILISSHILSEIEKMCDRILFMSQGEIKDIKNVKNELSEDRTTYTCVTSHAFEGEQLLKTLPYVKNVQIKSKEVLEFNLKPSDLMSVLQAFIHENLIIIEIYIKRQSLEEQFVEWAQGENNV
ncbi:ABC transporter ATP-binding protein [Bacillus sp. Hm123]|uniref:ABC transporter ATP-binding protein n=1 Tax=Bacillus sp. Hm123 TaxID=3450745 RepID=UPI003F42BB9C